MDPIPLVRTWAIAGICNSLSTDFVWDILPRLFKRSVLQTIIDQLSRDSVSVEIRVAVCKVKF